MSPEAAETRAPSRGWWRANGLLLAAAALRLVLALGLWAAACHVAPAEPHAWLSRTLKGPDAIAYQSDARQMHDYWVQGQDAFDPLLNDKYLGYPSLLAAVYWLTTPHPLVGVLLNVLCFLVVGLMIRRMALGLGQSPGVATGLALLALLWPPSLAYGSILLKDSLVMAAILVFLGFSLEAIRPGPGEETGGRVPWRVLVAGLAAFFLMCLRSEFQPVCLALGLLTGGLGVLAALRRTGRRGLLASVALALAVVGAFYLSHHFSLVRLAPPVTSELAPKKLAVPSAPQPALALAGAGPLAGVSLPEPRQGLIELRMRLTRLRWNYACTGGVSLDPGAQIIPFGAPPRLQVALRGLNNLFLFPYPWQAWPLGQGFSWSGALVSFQAVLWYLLLPGLAWGLVLGLRRHTLAALVILAWLVMLGAVLTFVDLNLGTLYRHRDMVILPLLPFLAATLYAWLGRRADTP